MPQKKEAKAKKFSKRPSKHERTFIKMIRIKC